MDIYSELGVKKYINAHDTYTLYGGSRMSAQVFEAMSSAAEHYVDINELQYAVGRRIAELTGNEAAYLTSGSCAGLLLAVAVCLSGDDEGIFDSLPNCCSDKNQIIAVRGHRNPFWSAITDAGATIVEIGSDSYADRDDLLRAISDKTAGIVYFSESELIGRCIPFEELSGIAGEAGIPLIVDAASQLPPAENLTYFTRSGADMVIFSGGKSLAGPQSSGFIVGSEKMIARCRKYGFPHFGLCRPCKIGKEEMVGLYMAIKQFVNTDHQNRYESLWKACSVFIKVMKDAGIADTEIAPCGPVGQNFPMAYGYFADSTSSERLKELMKEDGIYIGTSGNGFFVNPSDLSPAEIGFVAEALKRNVNLVQMAK